MSALGWCRRQWLETFGDVRKRMGQQMPDVTVKHSAHPHFGHTRHGLAVHLRTRDHLAPKAGDSRYQRFNKRIALWITQNTGTMTCFWIIEAACLLALPSVLFSMNIIHLKMLLTGYGFYLLLTWGISTNFQAIMLPALAVGQNIQNEAADARSAKQFEDQEQMTDWLNLQTQGGLTTVLTEVKAVRADFATTVDTLRKLVAPAPNVTVTVNGTPDPEELADNIHDAIRAKTLKAGGGM